MNDKIPTRRPGLPMLVVGAFLLVAACGSDDEEEAAVSVDCQAGAVPTFATVDAFQNVCTNCHSSSNVGDARNGAPDDVNLDVYASASAEAEEIVEEVSEGNMPPADSGLSLTEAQKQELYRWALCGTPQ